MGPAVAVIPIKVARHREEFVLRARICDVSEQRVHVVFVGRHPRRIQVPDHSSAQNEVPIVKVMVVAVFFACKHDIDEARGVPDLLVCVAKVGTGISCHVGRR